MVYVCVMDVVFSVCFVTPGAKGARVWEVGVYSSHSTISKCVRLRASG